jgi:hypothetical protein
MPDVVNEEIGDEPAGGAAAGSDAMGNHLVGSSGAAEDAAIGEDVDVGAVAAEFVLGTLDSGERAHANALLESDPHFRGMVGVWERRLGELHLMVEPVDPPPPIWESIKGKLKGVEQSPGAVRSDGEPVVSVEKTRATLEALEAELREEGLSVPPTAAADAELPALTATRADWKETSDPQPLSEASASRELHHHHPEQSARSWGVVAALMTLIALVLAGLIAAWRYFPDHLPQQLRAENVLNIHPPAPPPPPAPVRPSAPPESQFDE